MIGWLGFSSTVQPSTTIMSHANLITWCILGWFLFGTLVCLYKYHLSMINKNLSVWREYFFNLDLPEPFLAFAAAVFRARHHWDGVTVRYVMFKKDLMDFPPKQAIGASKTYALLLLFFVANIFWVNGCSIFIKTRIQIYKSISVHHTYAYLENIFTLSGR